MVKEAKSDEDSQEEPSRPATLVALLVLSCLSLLLVIALIVLMVVFGFMRFNNDSANLPIQLAQNCSDAYSVIRYITSQSYIISISFVLSLFKAAMTLVFLIICTKSLCSKGSADDQFQDTHSLPFFRYMGQKSLITGYIIQSMSIMAVTCVFGYFLSFALNLRRQCSYNYNHTIILVFTIISGELLFFDIIAFIIITRKLRVLQKPQPKLQKNQKIQTSRRKQLEMQKKTPKQYQPMNEQKNFAYSFLNSTNQRNDTIDNLVVNKPEESNKEKDEIQDRNINPIFISQEIPHYSPYDKVHRKQIYREDDVKPKISPKRSAQIFSPQNKNQLQQSPNKQSKFSFDNVYYNKSHEQSSYFQRLRSQQSEDRISPYEPLKNTVDRIKPHQSESFFQQSPSPPKSRMEQTSERKKRGIMASYIRNKYAD